jgi:hypothetical protein
LTVGLVAIATGGESVAVGAVWDIREERGGVASWASKVASPAAEALVGLSVPGAGVESPMLHPDAAWRLIDEWSRGREGAPSSTS